MISFWKGVIPCDFFSALLQAGGLFVVLDPSMHDAAAAAAAVAVAVAVATMVAAADGGGGDGGGGSRWHGKGKI
jgi:hypothetical protein